MSSAKSRNIGGRWLSKIRPKVAKPAPPPRLVCNCGDVTDRIAVIGIHHPLGMVCRVCGTIARIVQPPAPAEEEDTP